MTLIVHHLGHSQSDRIVWLCEELGLQYTLKKYDRSPVLAPPEFKALHPIGAAPVIEDTLPNSGDKEGKKIKLAETQACVEWICNKHGHGRLLVSPHEENYADFLYWYHITNGTLQPSVGRLMAMQLAGIPAGNETLKRYEAKIYQVLGLVDERLGRSTCLAGEELTVADIMIIFSLTTMREFCPFDLSNYKNILSYIQKIVKRPAYQSYLQKGDPDIAIHNYVQGPPPPKHPALAGHK
ncbi:glutathione S-transferase [Lecanosticta acicola]|uniref:Glutathione S-transferase n=1 Tax=Lecanosticta acicola TaxID=111012 RepID=A0AAI8YWE1_9PEZI|nr:glutathione S-transferase [Lecanosticta acicola]